MLFKEYSVEVTTNHNNIIKHTENWFIYHVKTCIKLSN